MTKFKVWNYVSALVIALLLVIPPVLAAAAPEDWDIQTVDPIDVMSTSLALDSTGNPHIAYTSPSLLSLHYAWWTGTAWEKETVVEGPATVASLALDSNDNPHICYTTGTFASLHYVRRVGSMWVVDTVDARDVSDCSMVLDSNNHPHISYTLGDSGYLIYAFWTGTEWIYDTVDDTGVFMFSSIKLDSAGNPHIAYASDLSGSLHYASWMGVDGADEIEGGGVAPALGGWAKETVDDAMVLSCSLAFDGSDRPHIAYSTFAPEGGFLNYTSRAGETWTKQTVAAADVSDCSLALDSDGSPHISYFETVGFFSDGIPLRTAPAAPADLTFTGKLKYAARAGQTWDIQLLDEETRTIHFAPISIFMLGKFTSIALDSDDLPHISYGSLVPFIVISSLHYAHFVPTTEVPSTPPTGTNPSPPMNVRQLAPANLSVQFITINPQQTAANQPVTITTNVVNTGDQAGSYNVALKINGQVEQTKMVAVGPQASQPVKFTVTKAQPGTYAVDIVDQKGSFMVMGEKSGSGTAGSNMGLIIVLAVMGVLVVTTLVVLLTRRS